MASSADILSASPALAPVVERARRAALTDVPVLLAGESGTGKEVVARFIHDVSPRRGRPFVAVNAAAVPFHLLESELFGHERGAFTGAERPRRGLFREAEGGTLLVDEIGDLPLPLQAKLLRVLQEREVRPVGGARSTPVDVRVVSATHRDLPSLVAAGDFRLDLYFRVSVFVIEIPPLRQRQGDVLELAARFLREHAAPGGAATLSPDAERVLLAHDWPGNVRELENACRHALVLVPPGGVVAPEHLPEALRLRRLPPPPALSLRATREQAERDRILAALASTAGNRTEAARRLGLSRQALHHRLRRLGIGSGAGRPEHVADAAEPWGDGLG